jgi:hypothetical protein
MAMQFSTSQDGKLRANVTITYRVGLDMLICVQAAKRADGPMNRKTLEQKVRRRLSWHGNDAMWTDHLSEEDLEWARKVVLSLYPELKE